MSEAKNEKAVRLYVEGDVNQLISKLKNPAQMRDDIQEYVTDAEETIRLWGGFEKVYDALTKNAAREEKQEYSAKFVKAYVDGMDGIKNETRSLAYTLNDILSVMKKTGRARLDEHKEKGLKVCKATLFDDNLADKMFNEDFGFVVKYADEKLQSWERLKRGESVDLHFLPNETQGNLGELKRLATICNEIKTRLIPGEISDFMYGKYFLRNVNDEHLIELSKYVEENCKEQDAKINNMVIIFEPAGIEGAVPYGCKNAKMHAESLEGTLKPKLKLKRDIKVPEKFDETVYMLEIYFKEVGM